MSETLSFPGLGLEFELDRVAFTVFGQNIYWYGILIAAAFLAGAALSLRRAKGFGVDPDRMMDVIFGGVLLGIVGARLYYVLLSWDTYRDNPISVFNIRLGGLAIYGGVIGAVIGAYLVCRMRKVKFLPALDTVAPGLLLAQAIGRWGNFVNIEAFGANTTMPWGMTSPTIQWYLERNQASLAAIGVTVDPQMPVHPTFFYESAWCLLGFGFLLWYTRRRRFDGELFLLYLGWYGLGRSVIEGLRTDSLTIGAIRVSQIVAILCVAFTLVVWLMVRSRIKREGDPAFLQLYADTDEGKLVAAGEFYKKKEEPTESDEPAEPGPDSLEEAPEEETADTQPDAGQPEESSPAESGEPPAGPDSAPAGDGGSPEQTGEAASDAPPTAEASPEPEGEGKADA